ncbi:hypothetical protein ABNF97_09530 [Plantactinospora sp. B6F1]|uniref:hypothetical protein n=1 Tax=Plantactinospora sp. B6F1 TaxID=3158971 RepID=UPI0032D921CF
MAATVQTAATPDEPRAGQFPTVNPSTMRVDQIDDRGDGRHLVAVPQQDVSAAVVDFLRYLSNRIGHASIEVQRAYWIGYGDGVHDANAVDDADRLADDVALCARVDAIVRKYDRQRPGPERSRELRAELDAAAVDFGRVVAASEAGV